MSNIIAKPATPPTMPPTRACVGGAPPPPELLLELGDGEGVGAVVPELPLPPAPGAIGLDIADAKDAWLESCEDADVDSGVADEAGMDVIPSRLVVDARF